ncbi:MAG: nucleotidyltransferase family protein [Armatimonadetes bacterium]|nr:nucleotidyltransferase family protein [Armatimonadota bacterium]
MVSQSVKAVVLAGGIAAWSGEPKALFKFSGIPLILRVVNELQALPSIVQIAVVASEPVLSILPEFPKPCVKVHATSDLWANTQLGIKAVQPEPDDYLLLCAADIPFVTAESLQKFLDEALKAEADLVYLAVPLSEVQRFFGSKKFRRTSAKLKEGILTGGNLILLRARALPNISAFADQAIRSRKSLWQLGQIAGWRLLLKWLLSLLPVVGDAFLVSVSELEKRGEELLGCRCKGIIADLPELAFDVDKLEDYELAQSISAQKLVKA